MQEEKFQQYVQQIFLILTLFCRNKGYELIVSAESDPYGKKTKESEEAKFRLKGIINAPTPADTVVFDVHAETNSMFIVELSVLMVKSLTSKIDAQLLTQVEELIQQIF